MELQPQADNQRERNGALRKTIECDNLVINESFINNHYNLLRQTSSNHLFVKNSLSSVNLSYLYSAGALASVRNPFLGSLAPVPNWNEWLQGSVVAKNIPNRSSRKTINQHKFVDVPLQSLEVSTGGERLKWTGFDCNYDDRFERGAYQYEAVKG